jgi:hypothetical protein
MVRSLNKLCVGAFISYISKRYPELQISRKLQVSKEKMRREMDVFGERENHVMDRPHIKTRKQFDDDESFYNMRPNDIGIPANDSYGGYASAFGNHLITNIPPGQKQNFNDDRSQRDGSIEHRFQNYANERKGMTQRAQPTDIDLSLDGSGKRQQMKKIQDQMQDPMQMPMSSGMMNNGMPSPMPMGMGSDDPYAMLLGSGAPQQNTLTSMPSGNIPMMQPMMSDQMSYQNQPMTEKSARLTQDFERKLAERRMIDMETGQPDNSQSYSTSNQMMGMPGNQMMGMPGNQMMGMPANQLMGLGGNQMNMPMFQMPMMTMQ